LKVLVASYGPSRAWNIPPEQVDWLRAQEPEVEFLYANDDATLAAALPSAEVAFSWKVKGELLASASSLKWIHTPNTGVRELISPELLASKVTLTNSSGVDARPIAEHVLALALTLSRKLHLAAQRQAARQWAQDELALSPPGLLAGKTLGLVGMGHIGKEVARLARAFGMRVVAVRRLGMLTRADPVPEVEVRGVEELNWLLEQTDVLVLAAPSTPSTQWLIDARAVAHMKQGAFLINVSRGDLVDETALVGALFAGKLAGAALDVTREEPLPVESPLWGLPNVVITPHAASLVPDDWQARAMLFLDNLRRFRKGEPLLNVVDKEQGY
jgi:phosphoglycerate dehydrogenase-like enzyme